MRSCRRTPRAPPPRRAALRLRKRLDRHGCRKTTSMHSGPVDCDDANATVFPGGDEVCDGLDNDCNGAPDDAIAEITCGVGACARKAACVNGIMPACEPGQPTQEVCDQQDNNCDGVVDNHGVVILHDVPSKNCRSIPNAVGRRPTFYPEALTVSVLNRVHAIGLRAISVDGQTFRIACGRH